MKPVIVLVVEREIDGRHCWFGKCRYCNWVAGRGRKKEEMAVTDALDHYAEKHAPSTTKRHYFSLDEKIRIKTAYHQAPYGQKTAVIREMVREIGGSFSHVSKICMGYA